MFDRNQKVQHHHHNREKSSSIGCECQGKPVEEISSNRSSDQSCSKGNRGRVQLLHTVDITKKVTEMNKKDIRQVSLYISNWLLTLIKNEIKQTNLSHRESSVISNLVKIATFHTTASN